MSYFDNVRLNSSGTNGILMAKADAADRKQSAPAARTAEQKSELDKLDKKIAELYASIEATNWFGIQSGYAGRDQLYLELAPLLVERNNDVNEHYSKLFLKVGGPEMGDRDVALQIYDFLNGGRKDNYIFLAENSGHFKTTQDSPINTVDEIDEYYQYVAQINEAETVLTRMGESSLESEEMTPADKDNLLTDRIAVVRAAITGLENLAKVNKKDKIYQVTTGKSSVKVEVEKKGKDHYNLLNAKLVLARLMFARRKEGQDADSALTGIYNEIINYTEDKEKLKAEIRYAKGTGDAEKEKDLKELIVGIRYLKLSAKLGIASLAISSQKSDVLKQAMTDINGAKAGSIKECGVIEGYMGLEKEIDAVAGYRKTKFDDKCRKTPSKSYDFYSAKAVLADLTLKYICLFGKTPDEKLTIVKDSQTILKNICDMYDEAVNPENVVFYGKFSRTFDARARLGKMNAAISLDKLASQYNVKNRKDAVPKALQELEDYVVPNVPYGQSQYLQALSQMATLKMMAAQGVDSEVKDTLDKLLIKSKDVVVQEASEGKPAKTETICLLDNITDAETKADVAARAQILICRNVMMDVQNAPDAETKLDVLVRKNSEGKINGGALYYLIRAKNAANEYKNACIKNGRAGNDMDKSFYADLYNTEANLKAQMAWVYKTLYEDLEEAGSTDAGTIDDHKASYQKYADEVPALYQKAQEMCDSNENFSLYDKRVRKSILELEKVNFEMSKISLKEAKDEKGVWSEAVFKQNLGLLQEKSKKLDEVANAITASTLDDEQRKYLDSQVAKARLNAMASQLFLLNNNNLKVTSKPDAERTVFERDDEIKKDYRTLRDLEGKTKDLTESEIFNVTQTMVGATTVMIRYDRPMAFINLGSYFDGLKKNIEGKRAKNPKKEPSVFFTTDMASAFSLYAMEKNLPKEAEYLLDNGFKRVEKNAKGLSKARSNAVLKKVYVKMGDLYNWIISKKGSIKTKKSNLAMAKGYYEQAVECGDTSLETAEKVAELGIRVDTVKDLIRDIAPGKRAKDLKDVRIPAYTAALASFNGIIAEGKKSGKVLESGYRGGLDVKAKMNSHVWRGVICLSMIEPVKLGIIDPASVKELTGVALTGNSENDVMELMKTANDYFVAAVALYKGLKDVMSIVKKNELGISGSSIYEAWANALAVIAVNVDPEKDKAGRDKMIAKAENVITEGKKVAKEENSDTSIARLDFTQTRIKAWTVVDKKKDSEQEKANKMEGVTSDFETDLHELTDLSMDDLRAVNYEGVDVRLLSDYGDVSGRSAYVVEGKTYAAKMKNDRYLKAMNTMNAIISLDTGDDVKEEMISGAIKLPDDDRKKYAEADDKYKIFMGDLEAKGSVDMIPEKERKGAADAATAQNELIVKYTGAKGKTEISAFMLARKGDLILANVDEQAERGAVTRYLDEAREYLMSAMDIFLAIDTRGEDGRAAKIIDTAAVKFSDALKNKESMDENIMQTLALLVQAEIRLYMSEIDDLDTRSNTAAQERWSNEKNIADKGRGVLITFLQGFGINVDRTDAKYNDKTVGVKYLGNTLNDKILSSAGQNNDELYNRLIMIVKERADLIRNGAHLTKPVKDAKEMFEKGKIPGKIDSDYDDADTTVRQ